MYGTLVALSTGACGASAQDFFYDMSMHIRQPTINATVTECQTCMIDAQ